MERRNTTGEEANRKAQKQARAIQPIEGAKARNRAALPTDSAGVLFQRVFESSRDAALICDETLKIVAATRAAIEMVGYTKEQILAMRLVDLCEGPISGLSELLDSRDSSLDESSASMVLVGRDGNSIETQFSCRRLIVDARTYLHIMVEQTAYSKCTQGEHERDELRALFESTEDLICYRDRNFRLVTFNSAFADLVQELFGVEARPGLKTTEYLPPDRRAYWDNVLNHVLEGHRHREEFSWCFDNGDIRFYELMLYPVRVGDGVSGIGEFTRDITAYKKAETAVEQSRARYARAARIARLGHWERDFAEDTAVWSDEIYDIFGITPGQFDSSYESFLRIVHPDDRQRLTDAVQSALATHKSLDVEYRIRRPDRTERLIHSMAEVAEDESGHVRGFAGTLQDITGLRRLEEAQRDSEELYRVTMESGSDLVFITDDVGHLTFVCANVKRILGYATEELETTGGIASLIGDNAFDPRELERAGELRGLELTITDKQGRERIFLTTVRRVSIQGGTILYVCRDISDRKKAEQELRASDDRFRLFHESSPLGYQSLDANGCLLGVNPAWLEMLGYRQERVLGRPFADFLTPPLRKLFPERFARFKETGRVIGAEWEMICQDGRTISVELDGRTSHDESGEFLLSHCVLRDITVRKRDERVMRMLANATMELVELPMEADLFRFVAEKIQALVEKAIVSANSIEGTKLTVRHVTGATNAALKLAERLMGGSVIDMPFEEVHEEARQQLLTGRLARVEGGLYELFFRTVPRPVCWTLEKAIGLKECYSIGIRHGENLLGNVTILTQNETQLNAEIIEAFVHEASIALERRIALEALRANEEKHRLLLTHAPLGIGYFDLEGRIILFNEAAAAHLGGKPNEFTGKSLVDLFGPQHGVAYLQRIHVAADRKQSHSYVDQAQLPSGEKWFRSTYSPMLGAADQVLGIQVISDDITELKRAERELQTAHQFLRTVLDSFPGNVAVLAQDGTVRMVNDSWLEFGKANGLSPEFLRMGINYLDICRQATGPWSEEAPEVLRAVEAVLAGHCQGFEIEYPCHSPDEQRWFNLQARGFTYQNEHWVVLAHINITERKQAEQALIESERKFRLVTETIEDVFWISTRGVGRTVYISPAYETLWERSAESLYQSPTSYLETVHPDDLEGLLKVVKDYHSNGISYECEYRIIRTNGDVRWIRERGYPVPQSEHGDQLMAGVCTNVTGQKRAQDQLEESQEQLKAIFDNSLNGIVVADDQGHYLAANQAAAQILGYSVSQLLTMKLNDLRTPTGSNARKLYGDCLEKGHHVGDFSFVRQDGEIRVAEFHAVRVRNDFNLSILSDVTERRRAAEVLRQSEEKYRTVVENAKEGIVVIQQSRRVYHNPRWLEITGYSETDYQRHPFMSLVHPDDHGGLRKTYEDFVSGHDLEDVVEFRLISREEGVKWLSIRVSRIEWNGRPAAMIFAEDITRRKAVESHLLEYQNQLRSLSSELALAEERERRRIGLGLHDHVAQSLAMIKFALQSLGETANDATGEALDRTCGEIDGLVDTLRSLSFELSDSILYTLGLKEAVEAYLARVIQQKHGLAYRLDAQADFPRLSEEVRIVLFRNLRELLTNVVKHAKAGQVDITLTATKDILKIEVRDDGVGFDPAAVDEACSEKHFGIFSVREQLAHLGGRMEVRSAPGRGACVTMMLPRPDER